MDDTRINTLPDSNEGMIQNIDVGSDKINTDLDATMHDLEMEAGNKDKERAIDNTTKNASEEIAYLRNSIERESDHSDATANKMPKGNILDPIIQKRFADAQIAYGRSEEARKGREDAYGRVQSLEKGLPSRLVSKANA